MRKYSAINFLGSFRFNSFASRVDAFFSGTVAGLIKSMILVFVGAR